MFASFPTSKECLVISANVCGCAKYGHGTICRFAAHHGRIWERSSAIHDYSNKVLRRTAHPLLCDVGAIPLRLEIETVATLLPLSNLILIIVLWKVNDFFKLPSGKLACFPGCDVFWIACNPDWIYPVLFC